MVLSTCRWHRYHNYNFHLIFIFTVLGRASSRRNIARSDWAWCSLLASQTPVEPSNPCQHGKRTLNDVDVDVLDTIGLLKHSRSRATGTEASQGGSGIGHIRMVLSTCRQHRYHNYNFHLIFILMLMYLTQ
ncbi:Hypothetical predicted protein [Octopus vulgaris]|uniref:Uncharacterized protein n=1 Tax=Octopus vulgaris TaxID=6645 RepID=A0AA36FQK8_OCTVU|nr:Hypothetical predicted protein [Octopus vulgaris]